MATFMLGVNYWPRRSAMYMWERFDLGEIREDFARIRGLGLQVVRFFLLWEAFQPEREHMDPAMLRRLDAVMDALADVHLRGMPSFFAGHMSGVNFVPLWALDHTQPSGRFRTFSGGREMPWGAADFYGGPLFEAARLHVRAVGQRYRSHPALFLWDLGNEFSNMRVPKSPQEAAGWSRRLTDDLLETSDIGTSAGNHAEDLTEDRNFRFRSFCEPLACAVMHGYTVYSDFARSRTDPNVVPFLCQVMQSLSGKPVLFNEFGNPTCPPTVPPDAAPYACLTEDEMAEYCSEVLERLWERGALGAFWWCWADYAPELADTPPFDLAKHELSFGIIRADGSEKPVAQVLREFAADRRRVIEAPPAILTDEENWFARLPGGVEDAYTAYLNTHA